MSSNTPGSLFSDFSSSSGDGIDIVHYTRLLFANKWKIIFFTAFLVGLAVLYVKPLRPIYAAQTTVLIETGRSAFEGDDVFGDSGAIGYLATQYGILRSRAFVEKVVDRLDLVNHPELDPRQVTQEKSVFQLIKEKILPEEEKAEEQVLVSPEDVLAYESFIRAHIVEVIGSSLSVVPDAGTQLVTIKMDSHDPFLAADVANELAEVYVESYLDARLAAAKKSAAWLSGRLGELQGNLRAAENQLIEYRESENLVDVQGITTLDAAELAQLRSDLISIRQERVAAESLYREVAQSTSVSVLGMLDIQVIAENQTVEDLVNDKAQADNNLRDLGRRYGAKHPLMIAASNEQQKAEKSLANRLSVLAKGIQEGYERSLLREGEVSKQVKLLEGRLQSLGRKEVKLRELERKVEASRQVYELFLGRGKEANEAIEFERPPARVIDTALPPQVPFGPNKLKYILAAFVLAIGSSSFLIILRDILDTTIRAPEEVESQLSIPLLGFLPQIKGKAAKDLSSSFNHGSVGANFIESVRSIRTSVVLSNLENPIKTILVTSSLPDEGKSTLALHLAQALGQMEKVLLIDADMRKPSIGQRTGFVHQGSGLSALINNECEPKDAIQNIEPENVDVLPVGDLPTRPLELISSPAFKKLLTSLESQYDRIIIDSPPAYVVSDSKVLATYSDAVVYVVKANATVKSVVNKGLQGLRNVNAPIIGVVLNQVDFKKASVYEPDYGVYGKPGVYGYYAKSANP